MPGAASGPEKLFAYAFRGRLGQQGRIAADEGPGVGVDAETGFGGQPGGPEQSERIVPEYAVRDGPDDPGLHIAGTVERVDKVPLSSDGRAEVDRDGVHSEIAAAQVGVEAAAGLPGEVYDDGRLGSDGNPHDVPDGIERDDVAVEGVRDRGGGLVSAGIEDDVDVGGLASHKAVAHGATDDVCADAALGQEGRRSADDM